MKKRLIIACAAILLAVTGCTAAVAVAAGGEDTKAPATEEELRAEGYTLTRYGDGIGVFREGELVLEVPVDVDGLRGVDKELIEKGIGSLSYEDILKLLEDFGA